MNELNFKIEGWLTGYRSSYWYTSLSTYVTIEFPRRVQITRISISQLTSSTAYTPFSSFRVSFGDDGFAYAFLPEVNQNII